MDGQPAAETAVPDDGIEGEPIDAAVDRLVDAGVDEGAARAALEHVTEDGVVTRDAVDDAIAHVSKVVATPETRAELAAEAVADARDAAAEAPDLEIITARLDRFESRLGRIEDDVDALGGTLDELVERADSAPLWELAQDIERLTHDANDAQQRADELAAAVEGFEDWLTDPRRRVEDIREDCNALRESVADLEGAFEAAMNGDAEDPALAWADASLRARLFALLLEDLREECEELRGWAEDAVPPDPAEDPGGGPGAVDTVGQLVVQLEDRLDALASRLDEAAEAEWESQYGETLAEFEEALAEHEPPIDAERVRRQFAAHREDVTDEQ